VNVYTPDDDKKCVWAYTLSRDRSKSPRPGTWRGMVGRSDIRRETDASIGVESSIRVVVVVEDGRTFFLDCVHDRRDDSRVSA